MANDRNGGARRGTLSVSSAFGRGLERCLQIRDQGGEVQCVTIGEGAWIGAGAIVLADVGKGTVVAAGSVVTKPLPEFVVAAGVPAKVIRQRFGGGEPDA